MVDKKGKHINLQRFREAPCVDVIKMGTQLRTPRNFRSNVSFLRYDAIIWMRNSRQLPSIRLYNRPLGRTLSKAFAISRKTAQNKIEPRFMAQLREIIIINICYIKLKYLWRMNMMEDSINGDMGVTITIKLLCLDFRKQFRAVILQVSND